MIVLKMNYIRMGRAFDPELITIILDQSSLIIYANIFYFVFAFSYAKLFVNSL